MVTNCIESENDKGIDKKVSLHDLYHQWRCLFPEALILNTAKIRSLDRFPSNIINPCNKLPADFTIFANENF